MTQSDFQKLRTLLAEATQLFSDTDSPRIPKLYDVHKKLLDLQIAVERALPTVQKKLKP